MTLMINDFKDFDRCLPHNGENSYKYRGKGEVKLYQSQHSQQLDKLYITTTH